MPRTAKPQSRSSEPHPSIATFNLQSSLLPSHSTCGPTNSNNSAGSLFGIFFAPDYLIDPVDQGETERALGNVGMWDLPAWN
jgi:hypothetical protein